MNDITALAQSHELLIANGNETARLLRHLANNEIDSDYFAVVSECESYGQETEAELSITDFALRAAGYVEALVEALEASLQDSDGVAGMAEHYETTISMLKGRITELEESHAQVIQSRDHYKHMTEEGLKQLAESRTVTVELPAHDRFFDYAEMALIYRDEQWQRTLTAAGIQVIEGDA